MMRSLAALTSFLFLLLVVMGGSVWWIESWLERPGPLATPTTVVIEQGMGAQSVAKLLATNKVLDNPYLFALATLFQNQTGKIRAGEYEFSKNVEPRQILKKLISGETLVHKLTIPEGLTKAEIVKRVRNEKSLVGAIDVFPEEGWLLPETYHFSRGDSRNDLIKRMRSAMERTLSELWQSRSSLLPFDTPEEALIVASIIEKETGQNHERARVSAVFINRLRMGMPLQSDPTVVYSLTKGKNSLNRKLTHADLRNSSKYNTYRHIGLPPGAITNPGKAAIIAALNPDVTDELYFVADGEGGHKFARTLIEHNRNVAQFRNKLKKAKDCGAC